MKKKLVSLVASLSIALGLTTSAISKDYESERVAQYRQFYKEYNDKDYKIKNSGTRVRSVDKEIKTEEVIEILYGNNLHDNTRDRYSRFFDSCMPKIDKQMFNYKGPDSSWYFVPFKELYEEREALPLESLEKEKVPQVVKDVLTLPKDLQKEILSIVRYHHDNDFWIMFYPGAEGETVRKIYDHLKSLDEARDLKQKGLEGQIQPIIPTENQLLPLDPFFLPIVFVDENDDGKADYMVELYCTNGTWFDSEADIKYITLTRWFELEQSDEKIGPKKHDKPFKITLDFDIGKDYEEDGYDINFYDENHDGYFERYELIKKK